MARVVSLKFEHEGDNHYCVVKIEKKVDLTRYLFQLNSKELDEMLNDDNVLLEKDGRIEVTVSSEDLRRSKLKLAIANAISDYFKLNPEVKAGL